MPPGWGADAVGMSTVPEVIAARHMGMRVLGITAITDMATGEQIKTVTHENVMAVARGVETKIMRPGKRIVQGRQIPLQSPHEQESPGIWIRCFRDTLGAA